MGTDWRAALYLIVALAGAWGALGQSNERCAVDGPRTDCGWLGINELGCQARGCCWAPVFDSNSPNKPWCFYKSRVASAYDITSMRETDLGLEGELQLTTSGLPYLGRDIKQLKLSVQFETKGRLHVKISDLADSRWTVPESLLPRPSVSTAASDPLYTFNYERSPFSFSVVRNEDGDVLFDTMQHSLFFKQQYLELSSSISGSAALYGIGERTRSEGIRLQRDGVPTTLWNKDTAAADADTNLYGSHPFLMAIAEGGNAHGIFLLNSNGMDVLLDESTIAYRTLGGVLDFYFFLGPTPKDVIQQYQEVIGKPMMPPGWSLGFHQCRWGYRNVQELDTVIESYRAADIPLEAMWTDIDYMDGFRDFTLDQKNFDLPQMQALVTKLHDAGQRWVPIIDPGIKVDPGYPAYDIGIREDIFLKDTDGKRYIGKVWPGAVHFPDWFHPRAQDYWTEQLRQFHDTLVPFDGIWIDMNEASNFCQAPFETLESKGLGRRGLSEAAACSQNISLHLDLEYPPYRINNAEKTAPLSEKTIPVSIVHHDGTFEYDAHNLYGFMEAQLTHKAVEDILNERPFVLTRSSFSGSGKYTAHWSGDNSATWDDLRWSIGSILNSNLFGMPLVGADICGFNLQTTEELCTRWVSLGAFYPFSRAHSDHYPQELYLWDSVADAARKALKMRVRLIPYLYTAFKKANTEGGMVASPLWYEFPTDTNTYDNSRQYLLGSGVLVSPVLEEGHDHVDAYIPEGTWYNIWDYSAIQGPQTAYLPCPLGEIQVHVRAGTIIPMQRAANTTKQAAAGPLDLIVALPPSGEGLQSTLQNVDQYADGAVYMDRGAVAVNGPDSFTVNFEARVSGQRGRLVATTTFGGNALTAQHVPNLGNVTVLGVECGGQPQDPFWQEAASFSNIIVSGVRVTVNHAEYPPNSAVYDSQNGVLQLRDLNGDLAHDVVIEWGCEYSLSTV